MHGEIKNLTRWAEDHFAALCSVQNVTCNRSNDDRTGWDFIIEFPARRTPKTPHDRQEIERTARVQVKSKERGKPTARLKLTNAERFAKAEEPCFLVLVAADNGGQPVRIYAKHFWDTLIARTLKRLREADGKESALNRLSLSVKFTDEDDHTDDLIEWMENTISGLGSGYSQAKRNLVETLGYEDGGMQGNITIRADEIDAFVDHTLGLRPNFQPERIRLVDQRFGVEAAHPLFDGKPHHMEMRSTPEPCRLTIRDADDVTLHLDGELYRPGIPNLPSEQTRIRIWAEPLELIIRMDGSADLSAKFDGPEKRSLQRLHQLTTFMCAAHKGPIELTLSSETVPRFEMHGELPFTDEGGWFHEFDTALASLEAAAEYANEINVALSLDDLFENWEDVARFAGLISGPDASITVEASTKEIAEAPCSHLLFYGWLEIGDWTFCAITSRPTEQDQVENGSRTWQFGRPALIESFVGKGSAESYLPQLKAAFEKHRKRRGKGVALIYEGDFNAVPTDIFNSRTSEWAQVSVEEP